VGESRNLAAIVTKSARDRASIFSITRPRVSLNRDLADTEFETDLFVQLAADDPRQSIDWKDRKVVRSAAAWISGGIPQHIVRPYLFTRLHFAKGKRTDAKRPCQRAPHDC
jgi:hypothetical protein